MIVVRAAAQFCLVQNHFEREHLALAGAGPAGLIWDKLQVDHAERSKHEYNQIEIQAQGVFCIVTTKPGHKQGPSVQLVSLVV